MTTKERYLGLDAVCGIAALSVLIYHYAGHNTPYDPKIDWIRILKHGVEVFFVLSGFVISKTLSRSQSLWHFGISRFVRLYPTFWVCTFVTWFIVGTIGLHDREVGIRDLFGSMTMIGSLLNATLLRGEEPLRAVDGVYWSLQCELLFYMLSAVIVGVLGKSRAIKGYLLWMAISACVLLAPFETIYIKAASVLLNAPWAPHFFAGIILQHHLEGEIPFSATIVALSAAVTVAGAGLGIAPACVLIASILIVAWAAHRFPSPPGVLVWLGALSYPLYLTHQNIGYALLSKMHDNGIPALFAWVAVLLAALAIATGIHSLFEKFFLVRIRKGIARLCSSKQIYE